jgi:hypothetical protein
MLIAATYGRSMYKIYLDGFVGVDTAAVAGTAFRVFPNPASDFISFETGDKATFTNYSLNDITGNLVLSGPIDQTSNKGSVDISGLGSGIYIFTVKSKSLSRSVSIVKK